MPCRVQEGLSPRQLLLFYTENFSCHVQENSGFEPRGHQSPRIPLHSNSREDSCNVRGLATLPSHSDSPPLSGLVGALNLVSRALWLAPGPGAAAGCAQLLAQRGQRARLGGSGFPHIEFHAEKGQESQMGSEGLGSPSRAAEGGQVLGCPWAPGTPLTSPSITSTTLGREKLFPGVFVFLTLALSFYFYEPHWQFSAVFVGWCCVYYSLKAREKGQGCLHGMCEDAFSTHLFKLLKFN